MVKKKNKFILISFSLAIFFFIVSFFLSKDTGVGVKNLILVPSLIGILIGVLVIVYSKKKGKSNK